MDFSDLGEPLLGVAQQIRDLQSQLTQSESARTTLNTTIQDLRTRLEASERAAQGKAQVEIDLFESREQCATLRTQLEAQLEIHRENNAELDESKRSNAELQTRCARTESELARMTANWTAHEAKLKASEDSSEVVETTEGKALDTQGFRRPRVELPAFKRRLDGGNADYYEIHDCKITGDGGAAMRERMQQFTPSNKRVEVLTPHEWRLTLLAEEDLESRKPMKREEPTPEIISQGTVVANTSTSPLSLSGVIDNALQRSDEHLTSSAERDLRDQQTHPPTPESAVDDKANGSKAQCLPSIGASSNLAFENRALEGKVSDSPSSIDKTNGKTDISSPATQLGQSKRRWADETSDEEFQLAIARRRSCCVNCFRYDHECDPEPQCQTCLSAGLKCVRKVCQLAYDCLDSRCPYLHPGQYDSGDPRWNLEYGTMSKENGNE